MVSAMVDRRKPIILVDEPADCEVVVIRVRRDRVVRVTRFDSVDLSAHTEKGKLLSAAIAAAKRKGVSVARLVSAIEQVIEQESGDA